VAAINAGELQIKVSANTDDIKAMKSELSKLKGSTKSAQQGFGGLSKTLGSSIGKFVGIGAAIAGAGLALRGLSNGLKQSIAAFNSQQRAEAQLNAVLKSTKGAAGLTANEIKKLGSEIQRTTEFEDDMVIKSSSLLLTFTKISKDTFPRAQRAIADMAAAMGTDLQAATIQVGKAMNDVKLGISALSRVGIPVQRGTKRPDQHPRRRRANCRGSRDYTRGTRDSVRRCRGGYRGHVRRINKPIEEQRRRSTRGNGGPDRRGNATADR
jgi:hypothetical protein